MFSREDLECLDPGYFEIIYMDDRDVTIMSRNTRHMWYIHNPEIPMRWSWRMWKRIPVVRRRQGRHRGMWCGMVLRGSRCRFLLRRSGLRSWQGMRTG